MQQFSLEFFVRSENQETDELFEKIRKGSELEREVALDALIALANSSDNPDYRNLAGLGMHYTGFTNDAITVFTDLVEQFPDEDLYRVNLATAYSQIEQIELCQFHLRILAEKGSTEEYKEYGSSKLSDYTNFLGVSEREKKLRELQIKSLGNKVSSGSATPQNFIDLGRSLILQSKTTLNRQYFADATSTFEKGMELFPDNVQLLEHLIASYLHEDPDDRLDITIAKLERLAPDSKVLSMMESISEEDIETHVKKMSQRVDSLFQTIINEKGEVRNGALKDLQLIVNTYPDNQNYRLNLAFALSFIGELDTAKIEAETLASDPIDTHTFHFNLGQVFWFTGNYPAGRHHLQLAIRLATNDQERNDAIERLAYLENLNHDKGRTT